MSLTLTKNSGFQTAFTLASMLARGAKVVVGSIAFDTSYPTGGEEISLGFTPDIVLIEPTSSYLFSYDHTNAKVLAYTAVGTEVGNGTNLGTVTTKIIAIKVSN